MGGRRFVRSPIPVFDFDESVLEDDMEISAEKLRNTVTDKMSPENSLEQQSVELCANSTDEAARGTLGTMISGLFHGKPKPTAGRVEQPKKFPKIGPSQQEYVTSLQQPSPPRGQRQQQQPQRFLSPPMSPNQFAMGAWQSAGPWNGNANQWNGYRGQSGGNPGQWSGNTGQWSGNTGQWGGNPGQWGGYSSQWGGHVGPYNNLPSGISPSQWSGHSHQMNGARNADPHNAQLGNMNKPQKFVPDPRQTVGQSNRLNRAGDQLSGASKRRNGHSDPRGGASDGRGGASGPRDRVPNQWGGSSDQWGGAYDPWNGQWGGAYGQWGGQNKQWTQYGSHQYGQWGQYSDQMDKSRPAVTVPHRKIPLPDFPATMDKKSGRLNMDEVKSTMGDATVDENIRETGETVKRKEENIGEIFDVKLEDEAEKKLEVLRKEEEENKKTLTDFISCFKNTMDMSDN